MSKIDECISRLEEQLQSGNLLAEMEPSGVKLNDETADFTIRCEKIEWKCHRSILSKCDFFKACFSGGFKVRFHSSTPLATRSQWRLTGCLNQEAGEGFMTLEEDDPESIETFLHYLYTGDPSTAHPSCLPVDTVFAKNINVYVLANKYRMPNLKIKAMDNIRSEIGLVEANLGSDNPRCATRSRALMEALRDLYDEEADQYVAQEIREKIMESISALPRLWSEYAELDTLMGESSVIRADVLKSVANTMISQRREIQELHEEIHHLQLLSAKTT
ncbi:MAG: hypothetical protein Q9160_006100 [Pyrenula sp. 1 TL-2023]